MAGIQDGPSSIKGLAAQLFDEAHRVLELTDATQLDAALNLILGASRLYFTGAGRSRLMASAIAMRLMHLGCTSFVVAETTTPAIEPGDLLVAVSATGTGIAHQHLLIARGVGARSLAITAQAHSSLAGEADNLLLLPTAAITPPTKQFGGSLFEQTLLLVGDAICFAYQQRREVSVADMHRRHANLA